MSAFSDLLRPAKHAETRQAEILPDFLQGRAALGGLVGALGVRAMRVRADSGRPLQSVGMSRVAPAGVGAGGVEADVPGEGRAVTHARAGLHQNGTLCATVVGGFGRPRPSSLVIPAATAPPQPPPETHEPVPFIHDAYDEMTLAGDFGEPARLMADDRLRKRFNRAAKQKGRRPSC